MDLQSALQVVFERLTFGGGCFLLGLAVEYVLHPTQRTITWLEGKLCATSKRSPSIR